MKRFLARTSLFLLIQLAILSLVVRYAKPLRSNHFAYALQDKIERLESAPGPRIIFVGGSSVAFGIDGHLIRERLEREPVNLGLHAELGLDLPLRLVADRVQPRDLVVVAPEYALLLAPEKPLAEMEILQRVPEVYACLTTARAEQLKSSLDCGLIQLSQRVQSLVRGQPPVAAQPSVYLRSSFNEFGDMVAHYNRPAEKIERDGVRLACDRARLLDAIERLNRFYDECRSRGAEACFSFPPFPAEVLQQDRAAAGEIEFLLAEHLRFPIIDRPADGGFAWHEFYDTVYHLNRTGVVRRSTELAQRLQSLVALRIAAGESAEAR